MFRYLQTQAISLLANIISAASVFIFFIRSTDNEAGRQYLGFKTGEKGEGIATQQLLFLSILLTLITIVIDQLDHLRSPTH